MQPSTGSRWWRRSARPTASASSRPRTSWSGSGTTVCSATACWRPPSRLRREPAVDDEHLARDEARRVGRQEQDDGGDVLGLAEAPERRPAADLGELGLLEA